MENRNMQSVESKGIKKVGGIILVLASVLSKVKPWARFTACVLFMGFFPPAKKHADMWTG